MWLELQVDAVQNFSLFLLGIGKTNIFEFELAQNSLLADARFSEFEIVDNRWFINYFIQSFGSFHSIEDRHNVGN